MVSTRLAVNAARRRAPLWALAALLPGCAYLPPAPERPRDVFTLPVTTRGHLVKEEDLRQLTPGVSTRADVRSALGSPSHSGTFGDEVWYYISARTRQRPGNVPRLYDQRVVMVEFTPAGTVRSVREVEPREMRSVAMVPRETPVPGTERTLLQALFGNVGRIGPQAPTNQGPGFGGSASGR